jgi:hypothetical protein
MAIKTNKSDEGQKPANKKSITFYAAADVAEWISGLDAGEVSRHINDAIREGALKPKPKSLFQIPLGFYQMSSLLKILKGVEKEREADAENIDDPGDPEQYEAAREYVKEIADLVAHFEQFVK